jgi:hypothetical protein
MIVEAENAFNLHGIVLFDNHEVFALVDVQMTFVGQASLERRCCNRQVSVGFEGEANGYNED